MYHMWYTMPYHSGDGASGIRTHEGVWAPYAALKAGALDQLGHRSVTRLVEQGGLAPPGGRMVSPRPRLSAPPNRILLLGVAVCAATPPCLSPVSVPRNCPLSRTVSRLAPIPNVPAGRTCHSPCGQTEGVSEGSPSDSRWDWLLSVVSLVPAVC